MMPGTFPSEEDEIWFLERLKADPPAAVVWPERAFDDMPSRAITRTAPRVAAWVKQNYVPARGRMQRWVVMLPRDRARGR